MNKIADNKTRFSLTIEKDLKSKLEEKANKDGRSLNNLIIKILTDYVENKN